VFRPGSFMERCARRHGDPCTVRLGGFGPDGDTRNVVLVSDPATIKSIFTGGGDFARVFDSRVSMAPMFGERSILLIDGDPHMRQRKLMLPPFHGERMTRYGELMAEITDAELDRWEPGRPFALQPRMQAITLDVILRAVFGLDAGPDRDEVRERIELLLAEVANPLGELVLGLPPVVRAPILRMFQRKVDEANEVLYREIARRRDDPRLEERDDILSLLLLARDADGEPMTDAELRDQLVALLLAGHETTATSMAWTFELLFRHPAVHRRLEAECATEEGDGAYLDAVIQESLRLYPPIPVIDRTLAVPFEVAGYELPPGTVLAPCIYLAHRRADVYPDPTSFRPERFLGSKPETYSWIPFGGGIRRCIGASFATFEMKVVMTRILRRATLRAASARPEKIGRRAIVIAPRRGTRAVLHARAPAADAPTERELASAR
jgi:cytochrome P450